MPSEGTGLGTGTDGLIPAPPSSVAPSGIPTRPAVDVEGRGDGAIVLAEQAVDEPPESPPPSNNAPGDAGFPEPVQFIMPCAGLSGEVPGVAISVDPNGMPTGRVDCGLSGDVASMPVGGCVPGIVVCAIAAAEANQSMLVASAAPRYIRTSRCDADLVVLVSFGECWSRMKIAPG
ncbi:hypothetical protein GPL20_01735 [Bradyrhizobium cajani]|uniref:Uncharacterized protein n=1 Tax=Bradyrhizobium cajani TaxID=1928661 RepID=A0A844T717_9BRAD|nr:hypothetical protein [Bradyrhizobium cajani]